MIKYTPFIQNYVFILLLLRIENLFIDPRLLVKKTTKFYLDQFQEKSTWIVNSPLEKETSTPLQTKRKRKDDLIIFFIRKFRQV